MGCVAKPRSDIVMDQTLHMLVITNNYQVRLAITNFADVVADKRQFILELVPRNIKFCQISLISIIEWISLLNTNESFIDIAVEI